jgi:hypothetical protein
MKKLNLLSVAICSSICSLFPLPLYATHYQDLWGNPDEPGWGITLTHQADTLFAALFIYDAANKPMWLLMSNGTKTGSNTYTGDLYQTTGPAFNAAGYNVSQVTVSTVGSATFSFEDPYSGTFVYSVNGVTVSQRISRQTYANLPVGGSYHAVSLRGRSGCTDPSLNGNSYVFARDIELSVSGPILTYRYSYNDADGTVAGTCSASAPYTQYGSLLHFAAPFTCSNGTAGNLTMSDMKVAASGLLGKIVWEYNATNFNCVVTDVLSAARRY